MRVDDQQLWEQFKRGDERAFRQLYQLHLRHLLNYGLRLHRSLSAVEDCVQDLFAELWQYRANLTQPASVRFYLLRGLRNRLKARYRRDLPFVSGWDEEQPPPFLIEPSTEQRWIELNVDENLRSQIQQALALLSPRQREILYLRYFNNLSYEQVCEVMEISYQTARSQVYHAFKLIRKELKFNKLSLIACLLYSL